jgi:hypothetical protein
MIKYHTIRIDRDATRATDIQPQARRRPVVRRLAVIRTDGSGFSLARAPAELGPTHQ